MKRIALIGASRGLGEALVRHIQEVAPASQLLLVSRKLEKLKALARPQDSYLSHDLSLQETSCELLAALDEFEPQRIFYLAGGGPFGAYAQKKWRDHQWAWRVSFERAAQVTHWALQQREVRQLILTGSNVAEIGGDPLAASYAAAKSALLGLYQSLVAEGLPETFDLRLFSPTYIDTELLPPRAKPRLKQLESPIHDAALLPRDKVACAFWAWAEEKDSRCGHWQLKSLD